MMDGLVFKEAPFRTEGPKGYLLRLSEVNCISIHDCEALGVAFDVRLLDAHHLLPDRRLDPDLWAWVEQIAQQTRDKGRVWNLNYARFCPQCLHEDAHWRAHWELRYFDACPRHGTWMIDTCSSCDKLVTWKRGQLLRCSCGSSLLEEPARAAPEEVIELSRQLANKLDGSCDEGDGPTAAMNVDELQRTIGYLGVHLDSARSQATKKLFNPARMEQSWPITSHAAAVLRNWPSAFHSKFTEMHQKSSQDKAGLLKAFSRAYQYPHRALTSPSFDKIREAISVWITENWTQGVTARNRRVTESLRKSAQWMSASNEAARAGIRVSTLKQLVSEGALEGRVSTSPSGRKYFMVRVDQIDALSKADLHEVDMTTALKLLGLGKKRMQELLKLLFPTAYRPNDKPLSPWRINRTDVERYLSIGRGLREVTTPDELDISLREVLQYWAWTPHELIEFIDAVKKGKVEITSLISGGHGITRWVFRRQELRLWKHHHTPESANWLSVPTLAKALAIKQEVAYWLVRHEFIESEPLRTRRGCGAQVRRAELEHFRKTYVFATEIAERLRTSPKKVRALLAEQEIHPLSDSVSAEKCAKTFYRRTSHLAEILSDLRVVLEP